jgi:hypothetical protein
MGNTYKLNSENPGVRDNVGKLDNGMILSRVK